MIYGMGVDLIHISRIDQVLQRHGTLFARKVLGLEEQEEWEKLAIPQQARWLAKRWAAKEALAKATGLGMRLPVTWKTMSIGHNALGQPHWVFTDALAQWINEKQLHAHLSLSDERDSVIAYVILESR
jgi:holo-[acyl-carrier protein] synthase